MQLGKLLEGAGIECPEKYQNLEINRIVIDSQEASDGCKATLAGATILAAGAAAIALAKRKEEIQ